MTTLPTVPLPPRFAALARLAARDRLLLRETVGPLLLPVDDERDPVKLRRRRMTLAGSMLARLTDWGYLNRHCAESDAFPPFPGGVPYFTPTELCTKFAGVAKERAVVPGKRTKGPAAMDTHLPVHWHCCRLNALRLEPHELEQLQGPHGSFRNTPHCLSRDPDGWRVYRLYVASAMPERIVEEVRRQLDILEAHAQLGDWLRRGDLGLAILLREPSACADVRRRLAADDLAKTAVIRSYVAPTAETLADEISRNP